MLKIWTTSLIACAIAAGGACAQDQVAAGSEIYKEKCAECHGQRLVNTGGGADLRELRADERPRFLKSVNEGKGQMPAWGGTLSDEEIDQVWAYVRSRAND
jgi:mono/diheme cytochrome c family protein